MPARFRISILLFLTLIAAISVGYLIEYNLIFKTSNSRFVFKGIKPTDTRHLNSVQLKKRTLNVSSLKKYAKEGGYNATRCFMIDMSLPSGKKRFFVYNLKRDSVEYAGLVTHGSGSINPGGKLSFSNVPGSGCTSLGIYEIGNTYHGRFGLAYKLHGLQKTNNKAFERFVVLHAHACVPEAEIYPLDICPSLGCPTVSPQFFKILKMYLDKTSKPMLLSVYE